MASVPVTDHVGEELEAVLASYLRAVETGRAPDRMELLARHPELAPDLAAFFAGQDRFGRLAAPLREAVSAVQESTINEKLGEGGRLGDFHIIREIGRGGMGIVYEAEQISLSRRVALKVLPFAAALDAKQLQRFKNEAHAAAHLQHQNIVPVYYVGCERGVHFYAMQYVEGRTLAQLIAELRQARGEDRGSKIEDGGSRKPASHSDPMLTGPYIPEDRVARPESSKGVGVTSDSAHQATPFEDSGRATHDTANVNDRAAATETPSATPRSSTLDSRSSPFFHTVANLGIQVAEALEHAHQLGVIHRDIKPANLMIETSLLGPRASPLTPDPSPLRLWITDFGLAHCQGGCELTMSGDLLGTLRYMSPEQALAKRVIVDERTDIYSLGVTLYELLTLEPAFPGIDRQEVLRQIAFEEPKPPRRWNKAIPHELETIILKAMEKNPQDRYGTAQQLADDLRHFLEDKPIRARRPTFIQRFRKWTRRHPGVVRMAAAGLVVLLLGLAVSNVWITQLSHEKDDALSEKGTALIEKDNALGKAKENFEKAEKQSKLAVEKQKLAEKEEMTARRRFYAAQMNLANQAWEAGQPARVLELLEGQRPKFDEEDLRGFEWYYLWRLCMAQQRFILQGHKGGVMGLAFLPDGKTLASSDYSGVAKFWDVATGCERARLFRGPIGQGTLALSADGKLLAVSAGWNHDATVTVWEVTTGRHLASLAGTGFVLSLAFSPDGKTLATGVRSSNTVQLWEVGKWQLRVTLRGPKGDVGALAFSPDGQTLVSGVGFAGNTGQEGPRTTLWDLTIEPPRIKFQLPGAGSVAFSSDGMTLATSQAGRVHLYDVATRKERTSFGINLGAIATVVFSPDGNILASTASDRTVRIWKVDTAQQIGCLAHQAPVTFVAFSADGKTLASGDANNLVRLWDLERLADQITLQHDPGGVATLVFSADGKKLISVGQEVKFWDLPTGHASRSPIHLSPLLNGVMAAISRDGRMLASRDGLDVKLWDLPTGQIRAVIPGRPAWEVGSLAFSPDGKTLVMSHGSELIFWDVTMQRARATVPSDLGFFCIAFSPGVGVDVDDAEEIAGLQPFQ
jgi:WD40 repeat protein/serine/threonine protein kinase